MLTTIDLNLMQDKEQTQNSTISLTNLTAKNVLVRQDSKYIKIFDATQLNNSTFVFKDISFTQSTLKQNSNFIMKQGQKGTLTLENFLVDDISGELCQSLFRFQTINVDEGLPMQLTIENMTIKNS